VAEGEVLASVQDMSISRAAFLRSLPAAVGHAEFRVEGGEIVPVDPVRKWRIVIAALPELRLGMIALPRQRVQIFLGAGEDARRFLERFELAFRRAGG
jgi:hypothetical protein